ncbi:hypothetical protein ACNKF0_22500 [Nocardioides sp. T5]|uniref:hypothetical protein n=1 Tax=Nocardioides sp. T5 TaxID=3400182 RepID=UPI003A8A7EA5
MTESSGLPPEQEAVRRLLADTRHDGPPPPDVVARLDDTLAALRAERAAADTSPGRVVDIGSRRRRVAGIGLLAAASVVVAGVALGQPPAWRRRRRRLERRIGVGQLPGRGAHVRGRRWRLGRLGR